METAFITGNASKEDIMKDAETLSLDMNAIPNGLRIAMKQN